jgi:hypothetical protein
LTTPDTNRRKSREVKVCITHNDGRKADPLLNIYQPAAKVLAIRQLHSAAAVCSGCAGPILLRFWEAPPKDWSFEDP